VTLYNRPKVNF